MPSPAGVTLRGKRGVEVAVGFQHRQSMSSGREGWMTRSGVDRFVGREHELDRLSELLDVHRLVTVIGPGGVGKTRLVSEYLVRARSTRPATFVDLSSVSGSNAVAPAVAAALGLESAEDADGSPLWAWARGASGILALDNLEQIPDVADTIIELLDRSIELTIVATSRAPIGIAGEVEFHLPPLAGPTVGTIEAIESSASGTLFLDRARAIGRLSDIDAREAVDVVELIRLLDGLPLALELAAARTRILSPGAIVSRLARREIGVLEKANGSRHGSLTALLEWSLQLLTDQQRELLLAVSVCVGPFDVDFAELIAPSLATLPRLEALCSSSLLAVVDEVEHQPQFAVLQTIRSAALEQMPPRRELDLRHLHATAILDLCERNARSIRHGDARRGLNRLDMALADVRTALDWSVLNDPELGLRISARAAVYWDARGLHAEGRDFFARLLATSKPSAERGRALAALAFLGGDTSTDAIALEQLGREATALGERFNDPIGEAMGRAVVVRALGVARALPTATQTESGAAEEIDEHVARVNALARSSKDPEVEYYARQLEPAAAYWRYGPLDGRVMTAIEQTLMADRAAGASVSLCRDLVNQAEILALSGALVRATEVATEAVQLAEQLGDPVREMMARCKGAVPAAEMGDLVGARAYLRRAVALAATTDTRGADEVIDAVGVLAACEERWADAAWYHGAAEGAGGLGDDWNPGLRVWHQAMRRADPLEWKRNHKAGFAASLPEALDRCMADVAKEAARGGGRFRLRHGQLTKREVEVMTLIGRGLADQGIADTLFISAKTASVHASNVKAKLGLATRIEVALEARRLGLVDD
jgi:predicted ATPase/DNA-binding CsgD family transcriptional regulator